MYCTTQNGDYEKESVRKDSSNAQLDVIRILLTVGTFVGFRLGLTEIKGAYLQSGLIRREIFVAPPKEWSGPQGVLWRLRKPPYGIVEAGQQWAKVIEEWILSKEGGALERIHGLRQLYVMRDPLENITIKVAKVKDHFIIGSTVRLMPDFINRLP